MKEILDRLHAGQKLDARTLDEMRTAYERLTYLLPEGLSPNLLKERL